MIRLSRLPSTNTKFMFSTKNTISAFLSTVSLFYSLTTFSQNNTLTEKEKKDGWKLLFDGKTSTGWVGVFKDKFPDKGWKIENGELIVLKSDGGESTNGGDIVTTKLYSNFELTLEVKLTPVANSGVKYFVDPAQPTVTGKSALGLEFQLLDDERHPDAKNGRDGNRTIGSLYDLITASKDKKPAPIGEWNKVKIISNGNHVEHWLNGLKTVEYERGSKEFMDLIAISKYKDKPGFGLCKEGYILLQDHGDEVHFRNIKIKEL
mgnify:CR=1 FL=1